MSETTTSRGRKKLPLALKSNGKGNGLGENVAAARSRQLLMAMMAFRDGDFSVRLPADWQGMDGRIAEAFNQSLAHEGRISREVARLSVTVGKEGRLKQRMTLPGAVGGWAEQVDSINTLLDDLVRPTTEVARTIGAV
jgi:methyl-accepting chemotaxis protein